MARPPPPLLLGLLLLRLLLQLAAAGRPCGPTGLSRDTVLGRLGANITLTCQDKVPANATVLWQVEEQGSAGGWARRLAEGSMLLLRRLRYEDSGRYSCSVGSHLLRSLRLLVAEPPETPQVSCYRRSHDKDILCEWPQQERPSPGTRAMLWVKRRFVAENGTEQRCRYFSKARKFSCRVKVPPGTDDTKHLVVSTCVSNSAGGSAGKDKIITLSGVLKPDPPINVTVEALEKAPQRLRVNWSYPSSWDPRFYWLRFQVRYRPEPAPAFMEVRPCLLAWSCCLCLARLSPALCPLQVDQVTTTWLDIHDAWHGTRHVVQVRAKDEFGHGAWSEWSQEAVGTPWTDPRDLTSEMEPFSSQLPMEDGTYGVTLPPELFGEDHANSAGGSVMEPSTHPVASPYAFLVTGGSLLLGIALFVGIVVRYRQMWWTNEQERTKPEGEGQHMLVPLGLPLPTLNDTPLLSHSSPSAPGMLHITHSDYSSSGQ
ncbi:interleukin-6 receptor subunit alpha isoform X1 [Corvus moneduloides]|uniref:interleukin-6 receptor subunit alpha isoform X1 n=1 Tax=Corvus moneduloides TaxID=1196302 RepID=UPI0013640FAD|nr:interleukin-6 receptor subunit alpha isoform X1 [Corvus moneduloides]